jgi:DNA repair exonuclease SbcCD ATPase subunit
MYVKSLRISNILSIKDATLEFRDNGLVLLEGFNYDDDRANGAGKSAVFNALSFGLYGRLPRKITISELLRKNTKCGYVWAEVHTRRGTFTVRRSRPSGIEFTLGGEKIDLTQEEFEDALGLSYNQFIACMYTSQDSISRFLTMNDTSKKDMLLQLMDLDKFAACKKLVSADLSKLRADLDIKNREWERLQGEINAYENSRLSDEMVDITRENMVEIADKIEKVNHTIAQLQKVKQPDLTKYTEIERQIAVKKTQMQELRIHRQLKMDKFKQFADEIEKPFIGPVPDASCPYCDGELIISGKNVVRADDDKETEIVHNERVAVIRQQMNVVNQEIKEIDKKLAKDSELDALQKSIKDKINQESRDFNAAAQRITELRLFLSKQQADQALNQQQLDAYNIAQDKIIEIKKMLELLDKDRDRLIGDIELNELIVQIFSSTGAPAYIMDSIIDSFNEIINNYVDLIWSNASYTLLSYKENKSGEVRAKFSDQLVVNGQERSVGSLSGGELRALSLVVDFTLLEVLSKNFGIDMNPIIMDEPFSGLDTVGRELIIGILDQLAQDRQIWVVDHMNDCKGRFNIIYTVEKRSGISIIKRS